MIPEAKLIKSEITLRELHLPEETLLVRKSLIRWLALSLGIISKNESRDLVIDVFDAILKLHKEKAEMSSKDIELYVTKVNPNAQIKAIYYHLKRFQDLGILTRKKGIYYLGEGLGDVKSILKEIYLKRINSAFANIEKALERV